MNSEELAKRTAKRISSLTEVELIHSINEIENHPVFSQDLLAAIHTQDVEKMGRALLLALYVVNEKDIELHEGTDNE